MTTKLDSIDFVQYFPQLQDVANTHDVATHTQVSMDKLIESAFIELMMKDIDFSKMGSVWNDSKGDTGNSLLINQMLMKLMVGQG